MFERKIFRYMDLNNNRLKNNAKKLFALFGEEFTVEVNNYLKKEENKQLHESYLNFLEVFRVRNLILHENYFEGTEVEEFDFSYTFQDAKTFHTLSFDFLDYFKSKVNERLSNLDIRQ